MKKSLLFILLVVLSNTLLSADKLVTIGVRAHSGIEKAMAKWQPTAQYLSDSIPGYHFEIHPYININDLHDSIKNKSFDFILTNPSSYVTQEFDFGVRRIATLKNKRGNEAYTQFGSVIFTHAKRSDIDTLSDIKNKRFMAVAPKAFGGWRVAWFEFLRNGINPEKDFSSLSFGKLQENVVHSVLNDIVDAGTVRTDMLERMAEAGEINLQDIKIINRKTVENFSFQLSTDLYPEWPFAALKHISDELAQKVSIALFTIDPTHPAAIAGKYQGWTAPLDYRKVHTLLKTLKVAPYDDSEQINLSDIIEHYWPWLIVVSIFLSLITAFTIYLARINNQLSSTKNSLLSEIDERKAAEKELLEYRFHLEQKVIERTSELSSSNKELEAYSYSIAHDLRGPLRSITSFSQILKEDAGSKLDTDEHEYLRRIIKAGKSMAGLIDDILDLARVTRVEINPSSIDLNELISEVIDHLSLINEEKEVNWVIHDKLCIKADPKLIKLLLQNLLGNAQKFSKHADLPKIEFGETTIKGKQVFFVKDNGIGIDNTYFDKIFKPFERLVKPEDFEGTGIGLATVQRIINRHNGKIWVESELYKGSTFYFCVNCIEEKPREPLIKSN